MARRNDLVRGYAEALFAIAEAEGVLDTVEDELFRFARALDQQDELRSALTDLALPAERKEAVLNEILGDAANEHTLNLLRFIVSSGRARDLSAIVDRVVELASERREREVAEVRTAVELTDRQRERLVAALERATGKRIDLRILVDPSVIGGVVARVGDQVLDGSLRRRLELAREHVIGA